jgi:Ras GTPase-activating-like protein IQGAP2/3
MLQNLANKPSYAKEQYMMSLNPFVETNKARMNQFLNQLCEVGDFYESLEVSLVSLDLFLPGLPGMVKSSC